MSTLKNKQFMLLDERNPTGKNLIRIDADAVESEKVVFLKNTRNKRQLVNLLGLPQDNI